MEAVHADRAVQLLAWGENNRRDLPWRNTRDAWAVLVSEVMLQQTQVARVRRRYPELLARFPSPTVCAAAPLAEVIAAWTGLGYNRRAVNLHAAAVTMVARHGGRVPCTLGDLLALPGIGPYTARAVLAFAFEQPVAVVDTNVGRLLARWSGEQLSTARAQELADALVPPRAAWAWNQTLFDLASEVCSKRKPQCERCPVVRWCRWAGRGPDPARGSAHVSEPQPPFAGSDRQGRGQLVRALTGGPVDRADLAAAAGWPDDRPRARRVAAGLVRDGLARWRGDELVLGQPETQPSSGS